MSATPPNTQKNDQKSEKCPYPWIKEHASQVAEEVFVNGRIQSFYDSWCPQLKENIKMVDFGRTIAQMQTIYGKINKIGEVNEPTLSPNGFWSVTVKMFVDDIEFFTRISFNENKEVGECFFSRSCVYHPPNYIKKDKFEQIVINESDPKIILSKPVLSNSQQFPCALLIHTMINENVDIRMGYCFPGLDFEFLPSHGIGLLRSDFSQQMFEHGDPIINLASKLMETAMMRDDISKIYLILISFSSMHLPTILKKFQGIPSGIILINPCWNAIEGSPFKTLASQDIPSDLPILLLGGAYDNEKPPAEYDTWEKEIKKSKSHGSESIKYDSCDKFLMECPRQPIPQEYSIFEKHISDVPLRKMSQWIRTIEEKK